MPAVPGTGLASIAIAACARPFLARFEPIYTDLFTLLADPIERFGQPAERINIGAGGSLGGGAFDGEVRALAHGVDQPGLLGRVLDPGTVGLGVHGVGCAGNL